MATFTIEVSVDAGIEYFKKNPMLISDEIKEKAAQIKAINKWVSSLGPKDLAQLNACLDNTVENPMITLKESSETAKKVDDWKTVAVRKPPQDKSISDSRDKSISDSRKEDWADAAEREFGPHQYNVPDETNPKQYDDDIDDHQANIIEGELIQACNEVGKDSDHFFSKLISGIIPNQKMCNFADNCYNGAYCTYIHNSKEERVWKKLVPKMFKYYHWHKKYYGD